MSKPLKPWRETKDASGSEGRAAELFQKALPPRDASPAVQQRQLAVLRGDVLAPRRFRLSVPAAVAIFFGASMAFAATSSNVREWVREKMEAAGILRAAPKPVALAPTVHPERAERVEGSAPTIAPEAERVMEMEMLDVSDGGPRPQVAVAPIRKVPQNRPNVAAGVSNRGGTGSAPVAPPAPPATEKAAVPAPPSAPPATDTQAASQKPAMGGVLSSEDLPADVSGLTPPQRVEMMLKHGDLDEAQELLNQEKADHSDHMNLLRGELYRERKMCKQANHFFSSVIDTSGLPKSLYERALFGRAKCRQLLGEDATKDVERYRAIFPSGRL